MREDPELDKRLWHACSSNTPLIIGYTDLQFGHGGLYNSVGNYGSDSF